MCEKSPCCAVRTRHGVLHNAVPLRLCLFALKYFRNRRKFQPVSAPTHTRRAVLKAPRRTHRRVRGVKTGRMLKRGGAGFSATPLRS